jgi:four helix bundle protein
MAGYRDLKVWQKAHELTLDIYQLTKEFPDEEKFGLISQMRRAAYSVPSNIVEGKSRSSQKEFKFFLTIARGSIDELNYFLLL